MGFFVTLLLIVGAGLLFNSRSRISRLEYRLRLVEEELRRRIAAGSLVRVEPVVPETASISVPPSEPESNEIPVSAEPLPEIQPKIAAEPEPDSEPERPAAPEVAPEPEPELPAPAIAWSSPAERIVAPVGPEPAPIEDVEPEFEPKAIAVAEQPSPRPPRAAINFEELFGRRLPIWAGGITLAIAGVLIVKYAIDLGIFGRIFTPGVQAICGMLFGLGLIGGAEWAWREREKVADPRVSQALSGAGISTLYAALLVAANVYHLIAPLTAFFGLAAVTGGALWLSLRHGMPSALLGLAGGLAAPALTVGLDANVSMLSVYLGFTIAGLAGVSRMQRWPWLALLALLGGAGWSLWLILAGKALETLGVVSVGGFVILLAIVIPLFALNDTAQRALRAVAAVVGAVQLALLVAVGGFQPLHWGLFALIAAAGQFLAWRDRAFAIVPTLGAALSFLLLLLWPHPTGGWLLLIGLALAAIHAGPLLARMWSDPARLLRAIELSGIALAAPIVALRHYPLPFELPHAQAAWSGLGGAVVVLASTLHGWRKPDRNSDNRFPVLLLTGALLLSASAWFGFPHWQAPLWTMAVALGLLVLSLRADNGKVEGLGAAFAALALAQFGWTMVPRAGEALVLIGWPGAGTDTASLLRWGGLAAGFALFAWRSSRAALRVPASFLTAALAYGVVAQLVPAWVLPIAMAAVAALLLLILGKREDSQSEIVVLPFATASIMLLGLTGSHAVGEWLRLVELGEAPVSALAALRWAAVAALSLLLAARARQAALRSLGEAGTIGFAYGTLAQLVPGWTLPIALVAVAALALAAAWRWRGPRHDGLPMVYGLGAIGLLAITGANPLAEWLRLIGEGNGMLDGVAFARWGAVALFGGYLAFRSRPRVVRFAGEITAALLGYGALAQVVSQVAVPLIPPLALLALAWWSRNRAWPELRPAGTVLVLLSAGWAFLPLVNWLDLALQSLAGKPMAMARPDLGLAIIARRVAMPALLIGASVWLQHNRLPRPPRIALTGLAATMGLVAVHAFYRHGFASIFGYDFAATGLGQRLIWSGLLLGLGWIIRARAGERPAARIAAALLAAAAGLHTLWYSLLLHSPLWTEQHVGAMPLLNLLAPLFVIVPLSLHLLGKSRDELAGPAAQAMQPLLMLSVVGFAWATLRQAFHGSVLVEPGVSDLEDILRSILGIALAVGFLLWGIRRKRHDWRIASLVLMLAAVVKVFLFDASGLEGLLRIASFVALGFSLIGIGWLYSRQLRRSEG